MTSCDPATLETAALELAPAHPVLMPSWSVRESDARAPWMKPAMPPLPPVMPPASPGVAPTVKPGMSAWMPLALRDDGMAVSTSLSRIVCTRALCTSTVGDSPVTVTVSSRLPTRRSAFTVATNSPRSSTFSRLTTLKPGQRERHQIRARAQIDNPVLAGVVGDDRTDFFDQGRTGGLHRDAWQDGAGRVVDHAGNGGLRCCCRRKE